MAAVVKIANIFQKNKDKEDVSEFLQSLGEDWGLLVEGELKRSNDTNNKSLGGQQPRTSIDEEDNEKDYDMNMERIMAKFSNFNSSMNKQGNDEEDEDEEKQVEEDLKKEEEALDVFMKERDEMFSQDTEK